MRSIASRFSCISSIQLSRLLPAARPLIALIAAILATSGLHAQQQITVTTPSVGINDSFYEGIGVGWNARGGGFGFNNGGANQAVPAFGGFDPNAGANFGVGGFGGGGSFGFNLSANQGSSRSMVGQSASVTVPNGGGGFISNTSIRPFVTGLVPVVGAGQPELISPLQLKLQQLRAEGKSLAPTASHSESATPESATSESATSESARPASAAGVRRSTAESPALSLRALREQQQRQSAQQDNSGEALRWAREGWEAEQDGEYFVARHFYRQALAVAQEPLAARIRTRLDAVGKQQPK